MKKCNKCKIEKPLLEFSKEKRLKDGHQIKCKSCNKQYYLDNKQKKNKWYLYNKEKRIQYNINNREKRKQYDLDNREKINQYQKVYYLENKLKCTTRNLIWKSLKNKGYTKKSRTHQILGCDYETFKLHLEAQFTKGMNWSNHGKWHLDHIYPVSLARNEQHMIELNHYTNFQPLWAVDNIKKGNLIQEKQLFLL